MTRIGTLAAVAILLVVALVVTIWRRGRDNSALVTAAIGPLMVILVQAGLGAVWLVYRVVRMRRPPDRDGSGARVSRAVPAQRQTGCGAWVHAGSRGRADRGPHAGRGPRVDRARRRPSDRTHRHGNSPLCWHRGR